VGFALASFNSEQNEKDTVAEFDTSATCFSGAHAADGVGEEAAVQLSTEVQYLAEEIAALFPVGVESLDAFFARTPRFALAFSGGADSACLLGAAKAGCTVKAYMVKTAFQPNADVQDAQRVAAEWNVSLEVIYADVLAQPVIAANPPDRCYHCKSFIFGTILEHAHASGFSVLCDGTNASDMPQRRPGFRALAELGVVSPLRRAGLVKEQVRELGRKVGVSLADKPRFSCYAVHAPAGQPLTPQVLREVAASFGE
jgi:pyridinium-3,5-biscarboxylic acid mononucleotide sulfurtransferase